MTDRHALVLQHVPFEGPGAIADWLNHNGYRTSTCHLYQGDPIPDCAGIDWLVIMGGPMSVADESAHPFLNAEKQFLREALARNIPMVGICLGAQLIAEALGAAVSRNAHKEIGWFPVTPVADDALAGLFSDAPEVLHWHGDTFALPEGATALLKSAACENQAFIHNNQALALQFHLEMTEDGVAQICEACANELQAARWVQAAGVIKAPRDFTVLHQRLFALLDALAARQ